MTSKNELILQSFYPNKLSLLLSSIVCTALSVWSFHLIKNPGSYTGSYGSYRTEFWNNLPIEIQYLFFLLLILGTLLGLITLLPNSTYVRITNKGILYKGVTSLFKEKNLSWNVIDDFYIYSVPVNESTKYVKIKFKKTYLPNYAEKSLIIYGNPNKVLDIMKQNLIAFSPTHPPTH